MVDKILQFLVDNPTITIIGAITIIQISPIKINPWGAVLSFMKKTLGITALESEIKGMRKDFQEEKVASKRWNVLNFANSCRQGQAHTKEEWEHCLDELFLYEKYCKEYSVANGVIVECAKYLRTNYHTHLNANDFLE